MIRFRNWKLTGDIDARQNDHYTAEFRVAGLPKGYVKWELLWNFGSHLTTFTVDVSDGGDVGIVPLSRDDLAFSGIYRAQLRATDAQGGEKHSDEIELNIPHSFSEDAQWPEIPHAFKDYVATVKETISDEIILDVEDEIKAEVKEHNDSSEAHSELFKKLSDESGNALKAHDENDKAHSLMREALEKAITQTATTAAQNLANHNNGEEAHSGKFAALLAELKKAMSDHNTSTTAHHDIRELISGILQYLNLCEKKSEAENRMSAHNASTTAHNDIRETIAQLATRLNTIANSTDIDLDQLAEIVDYIKSNRTLIESVTTAKISYSDIVNDLQTNDARKPLSAQMGKELAEMIKRGSVTIVSETEITSDKADELFELWDNHGFCVMVTTDAKCKYLMLQGRVFSDYLYRLAFLGVSTEGMLVTKLLNQFGEIITTSTELGGSGGGEGGGGATPDWDAEPSEAGYIQNRTHYRRETEPGQGVLLNSNLEFRYELISVNSMSTSNVFEGKEYEITWNDNLYTCVAVVASGSLMLGNLALNYVGEDTREPFCFEIAQSGSFLTKRTSTAETIYVKVENKSAFEYVTLPVEYLPPEALNDNTVVIEAKNATADTYNEALNAYAAGKFCVLHDWSVRQTCKYYFLQPVFLSNNYMSFTNVDVNGQLVEARMANDGTITYKVTPLAKASGSSAEYVVAMYENGANAYRIYSDGQTSDVTFDVIINALNDERSSNLPAVGRVVFYLGTSDETQPATITTEYAFVAEKDKTTLVCTYPTPDGLRVYKWSANAYSYELVPLGGATSEYIETPLSVNEVRRGRYNTGVFDPAAKAICTVGFVKPFVVSAALTSADYRYCVTVYNNGAYVRTEGWLDSSTVYEFDHSAYQYKLYIGRVDNEYIYDFADCINSVKLVISTGDILKAYNALEAQSDTERRNTKTALEYAMRRNYDISYANAPAPLNLITYAGDNQIVHPKVLYFPNKFNKHRFWIAYNPYPRANAFYENPCVAYSDDGYEWTNIPANPLDDPGELGINTDVHLVYVESKNRLEIWWRYADNKDGTIEVRKEIIYRRTSTDGFNWSEKETVLVNDSGDTVQYLSPCILHDGSKYRVWVVNDTEGIVKYYEGLEETGGTATENIALNDTDLLPGAVLVNGNIEENEDYKHTEKIKLSASKTFSLTGKNKNGVPYHIPIRRIVAYDINGNLLSDYNIGTNIDGATISSTPTRPIVMNEAVDSVVLTLYKPEAYTEKTLTLEGVEGGTSGLSFVRDIPLAFPDDGKSHRLWHIDVIEDNGKTVMLPMCRARDSSVATEQTWSLFLCTSEDNITYTDPTQVIVGNPYGWDKQIYRSSIVNVDGEYRIYYTAQNEIQQHGLGVCTSRTLSNFVGKW